MARGKLQIDILGTSCAIQAEEDSAYLEFLLGYYRKIIKQIENSDSVKDPLKIAVLAGIMLCDELYKEKKKKTTRCLPKNSRKPSASRSK